MRYNVLDSDIVYIKANIMARKSKFDKLRGLYSAIRMKMAAGIEKGWERVLYQDLRIDGYTGTWKGYIFSDISPHISPHIYKPARPIYISDEPEAWLTMLAPYLEDGFIRFSSRETSKSKCYAIKTGKLYDARRCTGHIFDYFGANYRLLYRIDYYYNEEGDWVVDIREGQDDNTGTWFSYGLRAIIEEEPWYLQE